MAGYGYTQIQALSSRVNTTIVEETSVSPTYDYLTGEPVPANDVDATDLQSRVQKLEAQAEDLASSVDDAASRANAAQDAAEEAERRAMQPCLIYGQFC